MLDGIDLYVTEVHNVSHYAGDGTAEDFRGLHVLVSFATAEEERRQLLPIRHALAFGRTTHLTGADWPERLAMLTAPSRPDFALAVIYAGSSEFVAAETVQQSIDELRQQLGQTLAAIVVVRGDGNCDGGLQDVTGFIRGAAVTTADTARNVYLGLSAFFAPDTLDGIDLLDLLPVLGPAAAPAILAEAICIRGGAGRVRYLSHSSQRAVENARRIVVVPFQRHSSWDELQLIRRAVREEARKHSGVVTFGTRHAFTPTIMNSTAAFLVLFCQAQVSPSQPPDC